MRHLTGAGWRRGALAAVTAAALAAGAAACSFEDDGGSGDGDGGQQAQQLRVGVQGLPPGQGNPFSALGSPSIYTWSALFDALTLVDATGEVTGALATEWANTSETSWRFTLREGVTFSNGEPFDADAVVATFDYLHTEEGQDTTVGQELTGIESASAVSATEVEFTTSEPDPILPARLSSMYIVAPGAWEELGPEGFATEPVGTGSYQVQAWQPGEVTMVAYEQSWRPAATGELTVVELAEPASRLQALASGQLDLAVGLAPDQAGQVESAGGTVEVNPAPQVMSLAFITTDPDAPLADPRVRQALNYAVNKDAIVENLLGGLAKPAGQGATPVAFGQNPDVAPYPFEPETATQLLTEAGYADGLELTADVVVGSFPADGQIYQAMAADLAAVGVDLTLNEVDFPTWLEKYLGGTWDTDAFGLSWNTAPTLDASRPYTLFSCAKQPPFFCDESVMPLHEQAATEFDPAARRAILQDLAVAVHENPPALFLVEQVDLNALAEGVSGYRNDNRTIAYHEMTAPA